MSMIAQSLRRRVRDALPRSWQGMLTLRANPVLGWFFKVLRRDFKPDGMRFSIPVETLRLDEIAPYWFNTYELPERTLVTKHLRQEDRVLELGACLGVVSCTINRLLADPQGHVAVEANVAVLPFLEKNRARNGARFTIKHAVLGRLDAAAANGQGDGLLKAMFVASEALEICRYDNLQSAHGPFTALVMDIEGSEHGLMADEPEMLAGMRLVILELHPGVLGAVKVEECRMMLHRAGLALVESVDGGENIVEAWQRADTT